MSPRSTDSSGSVSIGEAQGRGAAAEGHLAKSSTPHRSANLTARPKTRNRRPLSPVDDEEDIHLLGRIGDGDQEAFRLFYCRWSKRLNAVVLTLSRRGVVTDDLLQEVFLAIWRRAGSYDRSRGDVGGWLYVICRNKWVDFLRRQPPQASDEIEPMPARPEGRDARLDLETAMADLRPAEREAVRLAFFGGLTHEETAERLGIPLGTLKSRIRFGLRNMARTLRQYGQDC